MRLFTLLFLSLLLLSFSSPATAAQKLLGTACTGDQSAYDWDTMVQCNGSVFVKAPVALGAPSDATCNATTNKGTIRWTGTSFEGCDGSSWTSLGGTGGGSTCPAITAGSVTFTSSGTFNPATYSLSPTTTCPVRVRVVAVAGGGGGGGGYYGGGGGSGYYYTHTFFLTSSATKSVVVGTGGAGGAYTVTGSVGASSSFDGIAAIGGNPGTGGTSGSGGAGSANGGGKGISGSSIDLNTPFNSMNGKFLQGRLIYSKTFSAGSGGSNSGVGSSGGGAGGLNMSGTTGPTASNGTGSGAGYGGSGFGAGGGGGGASGAGGAGAAGVVYVEWGN